MAVNQHIDEKTKGAVPTQGSDGRDNTSARIDGRFYYNSRDESQAYSLVFDDASCTAGDFNVALFNNREDGFDLVVRSIGVNASNVASFKLHEVTGAASGGAVEATPYRLNRSGKTNISKSTASTVPNSDSSDITGLVSTAVIDHVGVTAGDHGEFRIDDGLRIGQGQGIAVETEIGASGTRSWGVIFYYFEKGKV